jgi:hypothetical protein
MAEIPLMNPTTSNLSLKFVDTGEKVRLSAQKADRPKSSIGIHHRPVSRLDHLRRR